MPYESPSGRNRQTGGRGRDNLSSHRQPRPRVAEPEVVAEPEKPAKTGRRVRRVKPAGPRVGNIIACVVLILLLGVMGVLGFQAYSRQFYTDTITPGVVVDGVEVGGLTIAEAFERIEERKRPILEAVSVTIRYGENTWHFGGNELRADATVEEALLEAASMARTGTLKERMQEAFRIRREGATLGTNMDIDRGQMASLLERIASLIDQEPVDAQMHINPDSARNYFYVSAEKSGIKVNREATLDAIFADLSGDWTADVELICDEVQASVTEAQLQNATHERAFFETAIARSSSDNRNANIRLAASQFNGMAIQPGETVSFNETTGERSKANGYLEALGIGSDKSFEDTLGGGVCQVSTTLYNACLLADLQIENRYRHSIPSSYVTIGFDAMVNWPNKDLRFTNNTNSPIYIRSQVTNNAVRFWIYGEPMEEGVTIERESEIVETTEKPGYKLVPDTNKEYAQYITYKDEAYIHVPSRAGQTVKTYLVWKKDGQEIKRMELHTDRFAAIEGIHYVGTKTRPAGDTSKTSSKCYIIGGPQDPGGAIQ